jgi:hypothetical protein
MTRKERATFNLLMVESGGAAPFPIYPSIPRYADLVMLQEVAKDACENKRGAWSDTMTLTGYEFRMCVRLYEVAKKLVAGKKLASRERYQETNLNHPIIVRQSSENIQTDFFFIRNHRSKEYLYVPITKKIIANIAI